MDLWIRSQDKMQLIKLNEIHIKVDEDGFVGFWVDNKKENLRYYLGTYKTRERALEVLDEMQNYLINNAFVKKINGLGEIQDVVPNPLFVYEMPKE